MKTVKDRFMEQVIVWLSFLGFLALLIGCALAGVLIAVSWMAGIRDYFEKSHFICAVIAFIVPPYGVFNGLMFMVKKRFGLECCSNYEVFQGVAECISLAMAERKNNLI
jgi:hypothetical protein